MVLPKDPGLGLEPSPSVPTSPTFLIRHQGRYYLARGAEAFPTSETAMTDEDRDAARHFDDVYAQSTKVADPAAIVEIVEPQAATMLFAAAMQGQTIRPG